jgi:hypothetical protein
LDESSIMVDVKHAWSHGWSHGGVWMRLRLENE